MGTAKGKRERKEKQKLKELEEQKKAGTLKPHAHKRLVFDTTAATKYIAKN